MNQPRITGPARAAIVEDIKRRYVDEKHAIRRIAADLGKSYGFVHRILQLADVNFRPRGSAGRTTAAKGRS